MFVYRTLCPDDDTPLKALHAALFPVAYEDAFYKKACFGLDDVRSVVCEVDGELAGCITFRVVPVLECEDAAALGLLGADPASQVAYILTLGTSESHRRKGIGSSLLHRMTVECRSLTECRLLYLHVIVDNAAALAFYDRHRFQHLALVHSFYHIPAPRSPVRGKELYDAYLLALALDGTLPTRRPVSAIFPGSSALHWLLALSCFGSRRR